jgi:hypothetical protein
VIPAHDNIPALVDAQSASGASVGLIGNVTGDDVGRDHSAIDVIQVYAAADRQFAALCGRVAVYGIALYLDVSNSVQGDAATLPVAVGGRRVVVDMVIVNLDVIARSCSE